MSATDILIYRMVKLLVWVIGEATGNGAQRKNVWAKEVDTEWERWVEEEASR